MSRFLRGVYSSVRNQWNSSVRSAPQSVCHEDEGPAIKEDHHPDLCIRLVSSPEDGTSRANVASAGDNLKQNNTYKPYVNKRFTSLHCGQIPRDDQALCTHYSLQCGSFSINDIDNNGQTSDCESTSKETLGKERWEFGFDTGGEDAGGREKKQQQSRGCFKNFSDTIGQGFTPLESLGWGVAVALGIHLSTAWDLDKHVRWARYNHRAVAMPMQNEAQAKRQSQAPKEYLTEDGSQKENPKEDISSFADPEQHNSPELEKAAADWKELSMKYTSRVCERLAGRYSKHGDYVTAVELWEQAADMGSIRASYNLGLCYHLGRGVEKDLHTAAKFYQEAGSKGHERAQYNLSVLVIHGEVPLGTIDTSQGQNRVVLDEKRLQVLSEILSKSKTVDASGDTSYKYNRPTVPGIKISEANLTTSGKVGGLPRSHSSPSNLYTLASEPTSPKNLQTENFSNKHENFTVDKHQSLRDLTGSNILNLETMDLEKMKPASSTGSSIAIDSSHNASLVLCT